MNEFEQDDKTFLLKLIMIMDIELSAYKYLSGNILFFQELEKDASKLFPDDFLKKYKDKAGNYKEEYVLRIEKQLDKILKIIRTPPQSTEVNVPLSNAFTIVGNFEEPRPETVEFNEESRQEPEKAVALFKKMDGYFQRMVDSLVAEMNQDIAQAVSWDLNNLNPEQNATANSLKNKIKSGISILEDYSLKKEFSKKINSLFPKFYDALLSLGDKFFSLIDEAEKNKLFNLSLEVPADNFWHSLLALAYFDFSNFKITVEKLDQNKLLSSQFTQPIFEKIILFLESNPDEILNLIIEKDLIKSVNSKILQQKLVEFFKTQGGLNRKSLIIDIFTKNKVDDNILSEIFDDILDRTDYLLMQKILVIDVFKTIIQAAKNEEFKKFIAEKADFNNDQFLKTFEKLFKEQPVLMGSLDSSFFATLSTKISQLENLEFKLKYINSFSDVNFINYATKIGFKNAVIDKLNQLKEEIKPENYPQEWTERLTAEKTKLENIINGMKGVNNGKRISRSRETGSRKQKYLGK